MMCQTINVLYQSSGRDWKKQAMWKTETKMGFDHFGTMLTVDSPAVKYVFELIDGSKTEYLAGGGKSNGRRRRRGSTLCASDDAEV